MRRFRSGGFAWDLDNDGGYDDATGPQVSHSFSTPGAKTVRLRVTDSEGEQSTTSDSVPVGPANSTPSAAFTVSPQRPNPGEGVNFDAGGTTDDLPLLPTAYAWDLDGDGQFDDALGITPSTTYTSGTRTVSLRVTDALGASDTASRTVTVNAPPSASFSFSPAAPDVGATVSFDAGASNDDLSLPSGAYGWDFDNNGSIDAGGEQVQHDFATAGGKTVRLQVTDSGGLSTSHHPEPHGQRAEHAAGALFHVRAGAPQRGAVGGLRRFRHDRRRDDRERRVRLGLRR